MKIRFKQKQVGWCCPLTLANLFQDDTLLQHVGDEKFKGCTTDEVKFLLKEHFDKNYSISTVAQSNVDYPPLTNQFVWDVLSKDLRDEFKHISDRMPIVPYFLSVKLHEKSKFWHFVSVVFCNGKLLYIDPYKENVIEVNSLTDLYVNFYSVSLIERLAMETEEGLKWACMFGDIYGYEEYFKKETA